jgi:hypothetical protein
MAHSIWKFRLPPDAVVRNREFGDEPARDHIVRIARSAGVSDENIRDRSTAEKTEIDVILDPDLEEVIFKLGCDAQVDRIC